MRVGVSEVGVDLAERAELVEFERRIGMPGPPGPAKPRPDAASMWEVNWWSRPSPSPAGDLWPEVMDIERPGGVSSVSDTEVCDCTPCSTFSGRGNKDVSFFLRRGNLKNVVVVVVVWVVVVVI